MVVTSYTSLHTATKLTSTMHGIQDLTTSKCLPIGLEQKRDKEVSRKISGIKQLGLVTLLRGFGYCPQPLVAGQFPGSTTSCCWPVPRLHNLLLLASSQVPYGVRAENEAIARVHNEDQVTCSINCIHETLRTSTLNTYCGAQQ